MKNKLLIGLSLLLSIIFINAKASAMQFYDTIGTNCEGAVERLAELEIVSGVSDNTYNVNRAVTRAEFAKFLMKASLRPSEYNALISDDAEIQFPDVDKKEWYYEYVVCAVNGGFMSGYEDGSFKPDKEISYAEISKMVTKALGHGYLVPTDPRGWEAEYVDKMYEYDLFDGVTKIESIHDKATRGNVAVIIWNMLTTNTWKMIYRNDTSGFTYVNSNETLMSQKILNYTFLKHAKIDGFEEVNGYLNVILDGKSYKLFDQTMDIYFSMIGGYTDVLLKRVEYPGKIMMYEVVGLSPDVGSNLITGTYNQVKSEGYDLTNKTRLSNGADYYYVYTNEDSETKDRVVSVSLDDFYIVESVKVDDEKENNSKDDVDKSHTPVPTNFEDDTIAYRYNTLYEEITRTIYINEDVELTGGPVLFKNNKRVSWTSLAKESIIAEITKNKYYFIITTSDKTVRLENYNNKKNDYRIYTSAGEYETYPATLYFDYLGNEAKIFNALSDRNLKELIGKNVDIYIDESGRVVKIELVEDEVKLEELNIGIYDGFDNIGDSSEYNELFIYMDGKKKTFRTNMKSVKADKGDVVKIGFSEKSKSLITSIIVVSNDTKLTDNFKMKQYKLDDLKSRVKYYDDDKIIINKIVYKYDFGEYDEPAGYEVKRITLQEFINYEAEGDVKASAVIDKQEGVLQIFLQDYSAKTKKYYGILTKQYMKDNKLNIQITQINGNKNSYAVQGAFNYNVGDFVVYKAVGKESIEMGEKYTTKILGYFKDLIVEDKITEKTRKAVGYELSNKGELDITNWKISANDEEYDLNKFDVFLINLGKNKTTGDYEFSRISLVTKSNISLEKGDRIAINEIEGAIIIYRGYTEKTT